MKLQEATEIMREVQGIEQQDADRFPFESAEAGKYLASMVRDFIEREAELGGWYTELLDAIGEGDISEGEIADPLADFTVGRFRVHLVQEGERYGVTGRLVYGEALSNGSFGTPINDCQLYGHGLPLVEFYDIANFPDGQLITRYYMSTLLGMDSTHDGIGDMGSLALDDGVPNWTIKGDDLKEVYSHLIAAREHLEPCTECGTFKDYGFGFHAREGSRTSYVIGEPVEDGWWVLVGKYDLTDNDFDYYIPVDLLNELLSRHGYPSMDALKEAQGGMWRNELTCIIAESQEDSRFVVPYHITPEPTLCDILNRLGVPEDAARTAVADARDMYDRDTARRESEKFVTLKGEVEQARRASAQMADNGSHSNRGQDAR